MKKLLTIVWLFICLKSFGQNGYPIPQKLGSDSTIVWVGQNFNGGIKGKLINNPYTDTTAANLQNPKVYPGSQIFTTSDEKFWVRNSTANRWIDISGSGGSVTGANNGLSLSGTDVQLGGSSITQPTAITLVSNPIQIIRNALDTTNQTDSNSLYLGNLSSAPATTSAYVSPRLIFRTSGRKTSGGAAATNQEFFFEAYGRLQNPNGGSVLRLGAVSNGITRYLYSITEAGQFQQNLNVGGTQFGNGTSTGGIAIGSATVPLQNATSSSSFNIGIGGSALAALTNGSYNIGIGYNALATTTIDNFNTAIGFNALAVNDTSLNTAVGYYALSLNTKGYSNAAFGVNALRDNTTGIKNTAIGAAALEETTTGSFNTAIGEDALLHNTTGSYNAGIGWLSWSQNITGDQNTGLGASTGRSVVYGYHNIALGAEAMYLSFTGANLQEDSVTNSIAIGAHSYTTASNQMRLGNDSLTSTYIYGLTHNNTNKLTVVMVDTTDNHVYHIPASQIVGTTPSFQQVLATESNAPIITAVNTNIQGFGAANAFNIIDFPQIGFSAANQVTIIAGDSILFDQQNEGHYRFTNIPYGSIDTTINKPVGVNAAGTIVRMNSWAQVDATPPAWSLAGNSIAAAGNFLGTTSNNSLRFYTNNTYRGRFDSSGAEFFIGSPTDDANHALKIQSLTNTAGHGIIVYAANLTANLTIGYQTIATSGGMILNSSATGVQVASRLYSGASGTAPTALIHIAAGAAGASAAPLKFTSGTNLTTAEAGAMEYNGSNFFLTATATNRRQVAISNVATPTSGYLLVGNGTDYTITAPGSVTGLAYIATAGTSTSTSDILVDLTNAPNTFEISTTSNGIGLKLTSNTSIIGDINGVGNGNRLTVDDGGSIFTFNAGTITANAYGAGAATFDAGGNITSVSDGRLKNILRPYKAGLKEVMQFNPVVYTWKPESKMETQHEYAGLDAREVYSVLGELGTGVNKQGYYSIQDRALIAMLITAIQEQQKEIELLKAKN